LGSSGADGASAGAGYGRGSRTQRGAAGALEEDARLTALFLWTLQSTNSEDRSQKSEARSEEEEGEEIEDGEEEGTKGNPRRATP
jgi:putative DNA methylase